MSTNQNKNTNAFSVVKADGTVVTWGGGAITYDGGYAGDSMLFFGNGGSGVVSENGKNRTLSMRGGWYPAL